MNPRLAFALLPALLAAAALHAQSFEGVVMDRDGESPVRAATVEALVGSRVAARTHTGDDGSFTLRLRQPGTFRLRVERIGYRTATSDGVPVAAEQTVRVEMRISTQEVALDPLTVVTRIEDARSPRLEREGFYARRQAHVGAFVTRDQIERQHPAHATDALRGIPGVRVQPLGGSTRSVALMSRKDGGCVPLLVVDRIPMPGTEMDLEIVPDDIEGIEVYRGPGEVPPPYAALVSPCGLIVVWSRDADAGDAADSTAAQP